MLNLQKRIQGVDENKEYLGTRISIRDKLLSQEVKELEKIFKNHPSCKLTFPSTSKLHEMELVVTPIEGLYRGGRFVFSITVPPEYNNVPPVVKCLTRVWHPNITEDGSICLSLLRQNSLDGFGWMPTRRMADVLMGLDSLFTDLMDFDDALNATAAQQYVQNKDGFARQVRDYIGRYCGTGMHHFNY
uniref:E2 NEDD8-conjugating enzyme n=1 Tax=Steinernema glaseri TaxID=37863 RepID=A0A1I7YEW3_9BILA